MSLIRAFVSYSWTSEDHATWVRELAERLRADGIETILDQWDLREGQDMYAFMEQMVTDPSVQKVIIVCDQRYAERADQREGGVGVESTIISQEVYGKVAERKFVPVLSEKDENGDPYRPVFLRSRVYIDLSDPLRFEENYEALLRTLADKPLRVAPPVGQLPSYLRDDAESEQATAPTAFKKRAAENAIINVRPTAVGQTQDYFDALRDALAQMAITRDDDDTGRLDALLLERLDRWTPLRNELLDFIRMALRYGFDDRLSEPLVQFFDEALPLTESSQATNCCHLDFALYEAFLYTFSLLVKLEQFNIAGELLSAYYRNPDRGSRDRLQRFTVFSIRASTIGNAFSRVKKVRYDSPMLGLLKERATNPLVTFKELIEPDLILYLRYCLDWSQTVEIDSWWSITLPALENQFAGRRELEFAKKARSRRYFERFKMILGVESKAELMEKYQILISKDSMLSPLRALNQDFVQQMIERFGTEA